MIPPGLFDSTADMLRSAADYGSAYFHPRLRLGVTGLARSGKTVFTTAMLQHLLAGSSLPVFRVSAEGRLRQARLVHQPDDLIPRFEYEDHWASLLGEARRWPESTRKISEISIKLDFERQSTWLGAKRGELSVDIVDYPGEWLLDLALLDQSYADWSRETLLASRQPERQAFARPWHETLLAHPPVQPADETVAAMIAERFKAYLAALRAGPEAVATTPPGRFLMPGDLEGSPALTFAPLEPNPQGAYPGKSLGSLMERRFEAYKAQIVRPFFREHFQRLDRQIVLIDVLAALDAGPKAIGELEASLDRVLSVFRTGRNSLWTSLFSPRIDKVLFAATKADHLHRTSHDRLEAILKLLVNRSIQRTQAGGAQVACLAMASIRATHETRVRTGLEMLSAVTGMPEAGEKIDGEIFDGLSEAAIFPGELPHEPESIFSGAVPPGSLRFPRFRPPRLQKDATGRVTPPPHIRLDRALEFLLSDRLE